MSRSMTLAVERIADDQPFAERFRDQPERALRRYRLTREQIDAIKQGDPASLTFQGVDIVAFEQGKRHGLRPYWRKVVVGVSVLGAVIGLVGAPAAADDSKRVHGVRKASLRQIRAGNAIRVGNVLVTRSSIRLGLRRAGAPRFAPGRAGLRAGLRQFCLRYGGKGCVVNVESIEPFVLADD